MRQVVHQAGNANWDISRRGILRLWWATVSSLILWSCMNADGVLRWSAPTNAAGKNAPKFDMIDPGWAMESITRFLQDVWDGDGTKAFSEIRPDEVAKKLTRNSMGAVVANLKRLLREAVSRDPRILARIKKDECNRIVNDILDLFGSDSLYDFVLSVTEKSNALGAAASARQELLGPDRSRLVHYNQEFPELFDRQGNQRAGYQHPSKIFTIFLFSKILGRPVSKSDLIGPEAVSQYQTQRIVTALSARIEERMRLVYERYSLEAPAITAGAATGTFLPVAGTIGVTVAPAVIDLFVADWRPRALQQAYESCLETIAEIRGIAHKNRSWSETSRHPEAESTIARMEILSVRLAALRGLLNQVNVYNSLGWDEEKLVHQVYREYELCLAAIRSPDHAGRKLPPSHEQLLVMNLELMISECLFLNGSFFGHLLSKVTGVGILKL